MAHRTVWPTGSGTLSPLFAAFGDQHGFIVFRTSQTREPAFLALMDYFKRVGVSPAVSWDNGGSWRPVRELANAAATTAPWVRFFPTLEANLPDDPQCAFAIACIVGSIAHPEGDDAGHPPAVRFDRDNFDRISVAYTLSQSSTASQAPADTAPASRKRRASTAQPDDLPPLLDACHALPAASRTTP